jgi:hypothetical protein
MSMSPVYIYKCVNITHELGTACSRPAAEPNGLCKDCSDAEKIGGISHFASGVFQSYPVSNVVSSIYTIGNWAEGLAGNTNVLSYPAQEKVRLFRMKSAASRIVSKQLLANFRRRKLAPQVTWSAKQNSRQRSPNWKRSKI